MVSAGTVLGVDFGTSHTVAVLSTVDGRRDPLLFESSPLLPSGVYAHDGVLLVGRDAERSARVDPARYEPNPKRRIAEGELRLGPVQVTVVDAIATVLGRVRDEAVRVLGGAPDRVVLSHPATWTQIRRDVLLAAAGQAHLDPVALVAEPVAAATYLATTSGTPVRAGQSVVVYDFGGGTFDISVVRRGDDGGWTVTAAAGLDDVGGVDLDAAIVRRALRHLRPENAARVSDPGSVAEHRARRHLWEDARAVKEQLTRTSVADLPLPFGEDDMQLTRDEFNDAVRPLLERTAALTTSTLFTSGVTATQLAGVFLVGGSSRVPLVATLLHRGLGVPPVVLEHPELVVAYGSLVQLAGPGAAEPQQPMPGQPWPPDALSAPWPGPAPTLLTPSAPWAPDTLGAGPDTPLVTEPASAPPFVPAAEDAPNPEPAGTEPAEAEPAGTELAGAGLAGTELAETELAGAGAARAVPETGAGNAGAAQRTTAFDAAPGPATVTLPVEMPTTVAATVAHQTGSAVGGASGGAEARGEGAGLAPADTTGDGATEFAPGAPGADHHTETGNDAAAPPPAAATGPAGRRVSRRGLLIGGGLVGAAAVGVGAWQFVERTGPDPRLVRALVEHGEPVSSLAYWAGGNQVLSAGKDGKVRIWNPDSGAVETTLSGGSGAVVAMSCAPDGSQAAAGYDDNTMYLWDRESEGDAYKIPQNFRTAVHGLAYTPDSRLLVSLADSVQVWHPNDAGQALREVTSFTGFLGSLAIAPDGEWIAAANADGKVFIWRTETGEPQAQYSGASGYVYGLAGSPDGNFLAATSNDGRVRIWSTDDGKQVRELNSSGRPLRTVAYAPNSQALGAAGDDHVIRLWQPQTGTRLFELHGHTGTVTALVFNHDGSRLFSAGEDGSIRIWRTA